jgi:hypothetical protein
MYYSKREWNTHGITLVYIPRLEGTSRTSNIVREDIKMLQGVGRDSQYATNVVTTSYSRKTVKTQHPLSIPSQPGHLFGVQYSAFQSELLLLRFKYLFGTKLFSAPVPDRIMNIDPSYCTSCQQRQSRWFHPFINGQGTYGLNIPQ